MIDVLTMIALFVIGGWSLFAFISLTFGLPIAIVLFIAKASRHE